MSDDATEANEKPGSKNALAERLEAAGFRPGRSSTRGGRHWCGLKLRPETTEPPW